MLKSLPPMLSEMPMLQVHYAMTAIINRGLKVAHCPIDREEYMLLREINRLSGLSQTELAECMGKDRNNLSRSCSRLEDKGLIRRTLRNNDKRHYVVELTERGKEVFTRANTALAHHRALSKMHCSEEEWTRFKEMLKIFLQNYLEMQYMSDEELIPDEEYRKPF